MKAAILTIGDEILIGQIVDTNSGYIAKALDGIGIDVVQMLSIGDDKNTILNTFAYLQTQVDLVIITGGLGPTKDDITKKTFAEYFNDSLVLNPDVLQHVTHLIERIYNRPISQINKDQALVPSNCTIFFNDFGTAPGMLMEKDKTLFISLPGVPYEMTHLMQDKVIPYLVKRFQRPYHIHQTVITYGVGESLLAEQIADWEDRLPSFIKLAYLPSPGRVRLRLSARGENQKLLQETLTTQIQKLSQILGDVIVGFEDDQPIEVVLGKLLTKKQLTLSTAESCTGGLLASKIVSAAGASKYFKGSIVAYQTELKTSLLQVSESIIEKHSVVSTEVAEAMAKGIQKQTNSHFGIGITGNAGPSSSTQANDLGVVCIAIATPDAIISERFDFGQPREKVILRAANKALEMLLKILSKN